MSAASDSGVGTSSAYPAPGSGTASPDETLDALLPRYARLGLSLAPARACVVRLRRGGERWQVAHAGERAGEIAGEASDPGLPPDPDEAFCDRLRRTRDALSEGERFGLPIGDVGGLMVRLAPGAALPPDAQAALADLAALLLREVGGGTERAAAAEAARAAAVEVEHQMRNGFAKINAMIDLAAREDLTRPDLVSTLKRRLAALGEANEVAIAHGFGPAPMDVVARAAFGAVLGTLQGGDAIDVAGEALLVSPAVASVLAPLLGELATDAAARGQFGGAGTIRFRWRLSEEDHQAVFTWHEPEPGGAEPFGSAFLRTGGPGTLRAEAMIDHGPDRGASYELAIPERFVSRPD